MSNHLILGGGGFIGSNLARRLTDDGHEVILVDTSFESFREKFYEGSVSMVFDLRFSDQVWELDWYLARDNWIPDVVWQLAADMGGVEYFHSDHDWQAALDNQLINANVMAWLSQVKFNPRVVFTSTACALATEKQTHDKMTFEAGQNMKCSDWTLKETDISWGTPDQLYGQEKRNSAIMWNAAPLDTRVCFLHTVYGPSQEHAGIKMKFPSAVAQKARAARETGTIELFGDGKQVRTYLYVGDAVDRLLALAGSREDPGFVNIGGTHPYTVDEVAVIASMAAQGGYSQPAELVHLLDKPSGVEARSCDMTKFNNHFPEFDEKWHPGRRPKSLDYGMKQMIDWLDKVDA